jgi:RimJ/RimL family protein N-acetyltransferase
MDEFASYHGEGDHNDVHDGCQASGELSEWIKCDRMFDHQRRIAMLQPLLRNDRVKLTGFRAADMDTFTRWEQDDEFLRLLRFAPAEPTNDNVWKKFYEKEKPQVKNEYSFAVRLVENDQLIGFCSLNDIMFNHQNAWIAIGIGEPEAQGKGYGYDTMSLLIRFAFNELNLHRVQLGVFAYNIRAIRLYEKLGFVREGTLREALLRDGQRFDLYNYGLLASEWRSRQNP